MENKKYLLHPPPNKVDETLQKALHILHNYVKWDIQYSLHFGSALKARKDVWQKNAQQLLEQHYLTLKKYDKMNDQQFTIKCTTHDTFLTSVSGNQNEYNFYPNPKEAVYFENKEYANYLCDKYNNQHPELNFEVIKASNLN